MIEQYWARFVTFVLGPVILVGTTALANWIQDILGMDLNAEELAVYIGAVVIGAGLALFAYVKNRGEWEIAERAREIAIEWHDKGEPYMSEPQPSTIKRENQ